MLVLCLVSSFTSCSEERPGRGLDSSAPPRSPTAANTPGGRVPPGTGTPAERTVVERTMGGETWRRDNEVVRIERAELLPSEGAGRSS